MKRLLLFLLLAANLQGAQNYYSPFTVNHTQVPSTQTDFPVLISVTDTRLKTLGNGGHVANANGYDIRPYSDTGLTTALTYQLEKFDATTGEVVMWVKESSLSSSVDTLIYLGYGDTTLTTNGSSTGTWDSNFFSVWHMNDNAASTTILEATAAGLNATNVANTSGKTTTGKIGLGLSYNGTTDSSSVALNFTTNHLLTLSFWINWTTNADNDKMAFEYTNNFNSKNGFVVNWNRSGGGGGTTGFGISQAGGSHYWTDTFPRPSQATWHYVVLVMDRTPATPFNKGYVDGTLQTLTADTHTLTGGDTADYDSSTLYFMSRGIASLFGAGSLDEVRVSLGERSADWVTASYNNQSAPTSFAPIGTEVSIGGAVANTGSLNLFFFLP